MRRMTAAVLGFGVVAGAGAWAQDKLVAGERINGYTGVAFDTTGYSYDYLVDGSLKQDDPANKRFRTLQAAYAAAPAGTAEKQTVVGIRPNVYLLGASESAPASLTITKNYITLLGLTDDRRKVVIADNRGNKEGANNNGFVLIVNATGFTAMNLSVVNFANMDYEYPGDSSKNLKMRSPIITQAVAVQAQGDKHIYSHVAILSRLDTMFIQTARSYFTNAYVEGTDDFLGGGQVSVFQDSEIYFPTGNGVMSASGITFINTVFKATHGLEFYKGFRNPDTLIDCVLPNASAWMVWKPPVRQNLYSLTYHVKDSGGRPLRLADSIVGPPVYTLSRELSEEEVKAFNPWNLLRATPNGVADDWDPANAKATFEANGNAVFRMAVTGGGANAPAGAGPFVSMAVSPSIRTGGAGTKIGAAVSPARAKAGTISWSSPSPLVSLSAATGDSVVVSGHNTGNRAEYVPVKAMAPNGFYATVHVYVEPAYVDAPAFTKSPMLGAPADGKLSVKYALKLDGKEDQSLISWYQCGDAACGSPRLVAVSRGSSPLTSYTLGAGDVGKYIKASIQPKHNISEPGPEKVVVSSGPVTAKDVKSATVDPNFRNFVEAENTAYENGEWTVLGTWTTSVGENLVNGYGLRVSNGPSAVAAPAAGGRPANPHAALLYQLDAPTGDMRVKVVMSPEKTAGQGFGIAGGPDDGERTQRADLFIKYDPRTKTGYSLRFWRTIQSAEKCMFQLYKVVNGVGTPLNEQQELTGVFKPETTITMTVTGNTFTAKGSNSVDGETLSLTGTVESNNFGGAGAYWSGSVPVGNSVVFSEFEIEYPGK